MPTPANTPKKLTAPSTACSPSMFPLTPIPRPSMSRASLGTPKFKRLESIYL
ncbi:hypothetical protein KSP40_PGU001165 [Platanthera guangdongensis]|uniref:Uncharacterized protein n=1 Tax=Platanthera guangdongensis TaxID=2320717 RepID=A0ABR2LHW1_9ASPA